MARDRENAKTVEQSPKEQKDTVSDGGKESPQKDADALEKEKNQEMLDAIKELKREEHPKSRTEYPSPMKLNSKRLGAFNQEKKMKQ